MPCTHNQSHPEATSSTAVNNPPNRRSQAESDVSTSAGDNEHDLEKGPPHYERITLLIDGLQCGCCEGGIERCLTRLSCVRKFQVNIVLARLEVELDTSRLQVSDLIGQLHHKTGYHFEPLQEPNSQTLALLVSYQLDLQRAARPSGVTLIEVSQNYRRINSRASCRPEDLASECLEQSPSTSSVFTFTRFLNSMRNVWIGGRRKTDSASQLVRLHYRAEQVGARDIFEHYLLLDPDLCLAPQPAHPSLAMGVCQIQRALCYFIPALACTIPVVVLAWAPVNHNKLAYSHASLALASIVQIIAMKEFLPGPLRSLLRLRVIEMDLLVAMSSTIAYVYSVITYAFKIKGRPLDHDSFFETSTMLVTLILLGRVMNEFASHRAAKSVSFRSLQADKALLVSNQTNSCDPTTRSIDARLLQYGDCFKVPPHSRVVTDGIVLCGGSEVDESMITGETIPVAKGVHSTVFAGTTNGGGSLIVRLTALPHENSVQKIAAMVESAELTKPKTQVLADRIAAYFVPVIAAISLVVFLAWLFVGRKTNRLAWRHAVTKALTYSIATLIVSCPCAIGLAVPMVVLVAGGVAARFGIVFRDPRKLETACRVTDLVFDKTGTLTRGLLVVVEENVIGDASQQHQTKKILLSLLHDIKHPVALSIIQHLESNAQGVGNNKNDSEEMIVAKTSLSPITSLGTIPDHGVVGATVVPGCGVQGVLKDSGTIVRAGNPEWLNIDIPQTDCTVFCVSIGSLATAGVVATFMLRDTERHTAELVIQRLQRQGIETHLISGDGEGPVSTIAHAVNIPKRNTKFRCKPEGKQNYIRDLQQSGKIVMFVGDGTNDSAGLKQADVGVHINHGDSDVAKAAADVVLMTTRLHDVLILLDISRAAYRRIILNFMWSAIYNVSAILLAGGAFTRIMKKVRIDPQWAALGELVSVLPVVLIAFQIRWRDYGKNYRAIEYDYLKKDAPEEKNVVRIRSTRSSEASEVNCAVRPCIVRAGKKA